MMRRSFALFLFAPCLLALAVLLGGCHDGVRGRSPSPVAGFVTDLPAFDAFIAGRPTPSQFRAAYPDVLLVLPGTMTTQEFRSNNSRYVAELDAEGRISGGRFM